MRSIARKRCTTHNAELALLVGSDRIFARFERKKAGMLQLSRLRAGSVD